MNRKLILAAMAVALSMNAVQATSNISGVTPTGNTYNITPAKFNGNVGYRTYEHFVLGNGDKANLVFERPDATRTQPEHFVNLVQNRVNINGVLNTVRNGAFYNGHAIFITPGGFTVGSSGVLNVGQLSVATPSTTKYNQLLTDYEANNFHEHIDQLSQLKQDSNATVIVEGKVLSRKGVDLRGTGVDVSGTILNGVNSSAVFDTKAQADTLFDSLVNTNGTFKNGVTFVSDGGRILIKSSKNDGMNVTGTIANGKGDLYLTNNGTDGLAADGAKLNSNTLVRLYNTDGDLAVTGESEINSANVILQNRGDSLTLASGLTADKVAKVKGTDTVTIQNEGGDLTLGAFSKVEAPTVNVFNASTAGDMVTQSGSEVVASNEAFFVNKGDSMSLNGTVKNTGTNGLTVINNFDGNMELNGVVNTKGTTNVNNWGTGITSDADITHNGNLKIANVGNGGLKFGGKINNTGDLRIYNDAGKLILETNPVAGEHKITNNGNVYIGSRTGSTGMEIYDNFEISNTGNMYIRNKGIDATGRGMGVNGIVSNTNGTLAINNDKGDMVIAGDVSIENGQMGIINRAGGGNMMLAATGTLTLENANTNIKNNGQGNMTINGVIDHDGRVNVIANNNAMVLNGTVHNNSGAMGNNGGFYAVVRQNGTGATLGSQFVVDGNGEVLIKNISGQDGLNYQGTINTEGYQAALSNKAGALTVSGAITTTDAPIVIYNADTGTGLYITHTAELNSGTEGQIINTAQNPMQVSPDAQITNMRQLGNR